MLTSRKRTIERIANKGIFVRPPMVEISTATKPMKVYLCDKRTSLEIAELLEMKHDNVKRKAQVLEKEGSLSFSQFEKNSSGGVGGRKAKVMAFDRDNSDDRNGT